MIDKIRALIKKYWNFAIYVLFGIVTTAVNYLVYFPLINYCGLSATVSNIIAWFASATVAFLTNKPFVFKSHDWSAKVVWPEATKFFGTRISSGLLETVTIFLTVDLLNWNGNIMKIAVSVFVIIINYVGSKLLVFRKKD